MSKEKEVYYDAQGNPVYPKKKKNPILIGCGSLLLIIFLLGACGVILGSMGSNSNTKSSDKSPSSKVLEGKSKKEIKDESLAKDPSSKEEALDTAQTYSDVLHFSEAQIEHMLKDINKFESEPIQYAIDNIDADYELNALKSAKSHLKNSPDMTKDELYEILTNSEHGDKFTEDEANYAMQNVDSYKPSKSNNSSSTDTTDNVSREFEAALQSAQNYVDTMPFSKAKLFEQLTSEYGSSFPEDAANYAIENVDVDYKEEAVEAANNYNQTMPMSDQELLNQLTSEHGEQFTQEEAQYALQNMDK